MSLPIQDLYASNAYLQFAASMGLSRWVRAGPVAD